MNLKLGETLRGCIMKKQSRRKKRAHAQKTHEKALKRHLKDARSKKQKREANSHRHNVVMAKRQEIVDRWMEAVNKHFNTK